MSNILHSSASVEWYTPEWVIDVAKDVMGTIDLDPASNVKAQKWIQAKKFYTKKEDGLKQIWSGNVFLNPPYARGQTQLWINRIVDDYNAQRIKQGFLLVNNTTDRKWFQPLWNFHICFLKKRVRFIAGDGRTKNQPTHGNVFVYLGMDGITFHGKMADYGHVVTPGHFGVSYGK